INPVLLNIYPCVFLTVRIIVVYVLFYCSPEQIMIRHEEWRAQTVKSELQKAVHSLELWKDLCGLLRSKPREIVWILICRNIFHKECIDRWLLKHGICPLCIYTIIQRCLPGTVSFGFFHIILLQHFKNLIIGQNVKMTSIAVFI
uniref:RING-type domain-containing protein n=1 Tax=Naja naja TaxID=35670 RepID=A0A8C6X5N7_NAJNA